MSSSLSAHGDDLGVCLVAVGPCKVPEVCSGPLRARLCVCPGRYLGVGLIRPAEPPSSTRRQPPTRLSRTSTVTDWARTPAAAHPALGPTDHRTPRRSTITTSPLTQSRTQPLAPPSRPDAATTMRPAPAQPFGAGSFLGAACERSECAVPSPARRAGVFQAVGARAGQAKPRPASRARARDDQ